MTAKERLHRLVDLLPEHETSVAERILEALSMPADPRLSLPDPEWDDEPETEAERSAVAEGWAALERGDVVRHEDLDAELARLRHAS